MSWALLAWCAGGGAFLLAALVVYALCRAAARGDGE